MLTLDERIKEDGTLERVTLDVDDGEIVLSIGADSARLPMEALDRVMARYGKPLDPTLSLDGLDKLDLVDGCALYHLRHLARYDVIARDFVVWASPGHEPLAELGAAVAAALIHLAKIARGGPR